MKTNTTTTTAKANNASDRVKFLLTPVNYNKEIHQETMDYLDQSTKSFRACKLGVEGLPEKVASKVTDIESQLQKMLVTESACGEGVTQTLKALKELKIPVKVVRERMKTICQYLQSCGVKGSSFSTLSRRMKELDFEQDAKKAAARAVGVKKAKEKKEKEAKPLAAALAEYAMNAAKSKAKARAALEAALALLA